MKVRSLLKTLRKCHKKYEAIKQCAYEADASNITLQRKAVNKYLTNLPGNGMFQSLMEKVNSLKLNDLGIDGEEDPYFFRQDTDYLDRNYPNISATHIVENENYAVLMFFLKKGASMPLHDHMDMCVYTRVLTGSLKYRALDKVHHGDYNTDPLSTFMYYRDKIHCEAVVKADEVLKKGDNKITLPFDKNIHSFTALEN